MNIEIAPLNTQYADKDCCICHDEFLQKQKCLALACGHLFHSLCIEPWIKNHPSCPTCRLRVTVLPKNILENILNGTDKRKNSISNRLKPVHHSIKTVAFCAMGVRLASETVKYLIDPNAFDEEGMEKNPYWHPLLLVACHIFFFATLYFFLKTKSKDVKVMNIPRVVVINQDNKLEISYYSI